MQYIFVLNSGLRDSNRTCWLQDTSTSYFCAVHFFSWSAKTKADIVKNNQGISKYVDAGKHPKIRSAVNQFASQTVIKIHVWLSLHGGEKAIKDFLWWFRAAE